MKVDEIVAEIECGKSTVEILSKHSGVITKHYAEEGDWIDIGEQFLEIDTNAKVPEGGAAAPKQEATAAAVSTDHILLIITHIVNSLFLTSN